MEFMGLFDYDSWREESSAKLVVATSITLRSEFDRRLLPTITRFVRLESHYDNSQRVDY